MKKYINKYEKMEKNEIPLNANFKHFFLQF